MSELKSASASLSNAFSTSALWILAAALFGLSMAFNWTALTYLLAACFFYIPVVCIHELGHAIAAVCLGGQVHYITLGQRPYTKEPPKKIKLGGFHWHWYSTSFCGAAYASFYSEWLYRSRWCLMIASGPLANFLAATPLLLVDFTHSDRFTPLWITWSCLNIYTGFSSFSPVELRPTETAVNRDISLIWKTLFYTNQEIQEHVRLAIFSRDYTRHIVELTGLDLAELLVLQAKEPANSSLQCCVFQQMQTEKDPRQLEYLRKFSLNPNTPKEVASGMIDGFLTHQLSLGPSNQPRIIDELCALLLKLDDCLSTRGTHGSILVNQGHVEEGRNVLKDVLIKTTSKIDKAYANIFLALAEKQQSNLDLAREYAEKAAKIDPNCPALKRVADLLPTVREPEKTIS